MKNIFGAAIVALLALTGAAHAADDLRPSYDSQAADLQNEDFGNVYLSGSFLYLNTSPAITKDTEAVGFKYAHDPLDGSFGAQIDGNMNFNTSGTIGTYKGVGHITHQLGDNSKIGFAVMYDSLNNLGLAVEDLYAFNNSTWVQAQIGVIGNTYSSSFPTPATYAVGSSINHVLNQNFSLRGDVAFWNYNQANLNEVDALATLQYTLDNFPISLSVGAGYDNLFSSTSSISGYSADAKLQWSFGGPSNGVHGKLMRANVFGLMP